MEAKTHGSESPHKKAEKRPYVTVTIDIFDHPKMRRLARDLGISPNDTVCHLLRLWIWCWKFRPDGDLCGTESIEIAEAAEWDGDPDLFVSSLERRGWLDKIADGWAVHDWFEHSGKVFAERQEKRDLMRKLRERRKTDEAAASVLPHNEVTVTEPLPHCEVTLPHNEVTVTEPLPDCDLVLPSNHNHNHNLRSIDLACIEGSADTASAVQRGPLEAQEPSEASGGYRDTNEPPNDAPSAQKPTKPKRQRETQEAAALSDRMIEAFAETYRIKVPAGPIPTADGATRKQALAIRSQCASDEEAIELCRWFPGQTGEPFYAKMMWSFGYLSMKAHLPQILVHFRTGASGSVVANHIRENQKIARQPRSGWGKQ